MAISGGKTRTVEGYVVRVSPYREKDGMVTILTETGLVSFLARGIMDPKTKNAGASRLLSKGSFLLKEGKNGGLSLTEAQIGLEIDGNDSLERLFLLLFMAELLGRLVSLDESEALYGWLETAMPLIDKEADPLTSSFLFLAFFLRETGYALNVDGCFRCGKKTDIVAVSYVDGGFSCREHLNGAALRKTPYQLKMLRYAFKVPPNELARVSFPKELLVPLIRELASHYAELTGYNLKSLTVLGVI